MDAQMASAVGAWAAALVAATVAVINLVVGRRQAEAAKMSAQAALMNAQNAGRYKVAEFRQAWIYKVIDNLCELQSIVMTNSPQPILSQEDKRDAEAARTRLGILLPPDEPDPAELFERLDAIEAAKTDEEREAGAAAMLVVARQLLKREWVRLKDELNAIKS